MLGRLTRRLNKSEVESCDGELSEAECRAALHGMSRGKTPGSDGFPMEFFVCFWDLLGPDLVRILNLAYQQGQLSISQRRGIIIVLYKKHDRLETKNYRPISLLNVDYKIATRAIAGRLLGVIGSIVGYDQTCGIPGHTISENLMLMRDLIEYADRADIPLALLSLDQEKAYDRATFDIYAQYERASGAKLNHGKSKGLWLGAWKDRQDTPHGINWVKELLLLGATISAGDYSTATWEAPVAKVEKRLSSWKGRQLTYQGKATVINTLGLSQIWHLCHVFTIPEWAKKRIVKATWGFFWSGRRDLVVRRTVCLPKGQGGFGVIDFDLKAKAFAIQWVKRYFAPTPAKWKAFFSFFSHLVDVNWKIAHGVLYTASRLKLSSISSLSVDTTTVVKHYLWVARNDFRFRDKRRTEADCLKAIIARLKFLLKVLASRCRSPSQIRSFEKQWLASLVLVLWLSLFLRLSVNGGRLHWLYCPDRLAFYIRKQRSGSGRIRCQTYHLSHNTLYIYFPGRNLHLVFLLYVTCLPTEFQAIAHTFQVLINWLVCHSSAHVLPVKLTKYQVNIQTSHYFTGAKADMFATLVSWLMPHGRRAPLHDGTRVRESTARVAHKCSSVDPCAIYNFLGGADHVEAKAINVRQVIDELRSQFRRLNFEPYGRIKLIKSEQYSNIYTGVRNVLMEARKKSAFNVLSLLCRIKYFCSGGNGVKERLSPLLQTFLVFFQTHGLRDQAKRNALFSWLNCVKADVVCLQETHSISRDEFVTWVSLESDAANNLQHYSVLSSPGSLCSRGIAVLYKPSLSVDAEIFDDIGRLQVIKFSVCGTASSSFQLVNVYGPNRKPDGEVFFESIGSQVDASLPTIVCGDFNTVVDPAIDRFGCNPTSPWAYNWPRSLQDFTHELDLHDIWRLRNPNTRSYTWHRANGLQASRLDMFWVSSSLLSHVIDVSIYPFFRSDHSYVFLQLTLPSLPRRGPGVWKLNASLLKDDNYKQKIQEFWQAWQLEQGTFPSLAVWWDAGKKRIRALTRRYSQQLARARRARIKSLENTLFHLHHRQQNGEDVSAWLNEAKTDLELEHLHVANGARIRSREQWAEEGETSSSYFFRQEKSRAIKRLFSGIKNAQGLVVHSISAIIRVWCLFYVQLFTAAILVPGDQAFFLGSLERSLSHTESALCEGAITEDECLKALRQMKNNKSPGVDGLPYEFYTRFWPVLGTDLISVYNDCFSSGCLSFSQQTGLITLLYKKGDKLDTKNWHPISLLCTDYKILAKVLTNRLVAVISSVVGPEQVCGVPSRLSSENIRLIKDAVDYANGSAMSAALVSLDQEKAFDRVDWSFMLRVLEAMNFGPSFRSWVQLLYTSLFSQVLVDDYVSQLFPVTRGVRQGCPLSPLLYILVAETIACAIRQDPNIDGLLLPNGSHTKLFQYADDTSIFVMSDQSLLALFLCLNDMNVHPGQS
ncbi:Hypothetical predicted protein [Paramuricea clavata]|uniref:Uncharacterized protein n=1 Tax=Paramuricea clavata TaxID=317549 RepID=A0A6S7GUL3_PARCT|nr:Hypothetical predicted protein [Paramuricea clavata]